VTPLAAAAAAAKVVRLRGEGGRRSGPNLTGVRFGHTKVSLLIKFYPACPKGTKTSNIQRTLYFLTRNLKDKIIPAKNPYREGFLFLVRTYVEFMVTF